MSPGAKGKPTEHLRRNDSVKIQRLTLQNILSFGEVPTSIDLRPLNVLIGPNASGKSNLLEAIDVLRSTSSDISATLRVGGGVSEWIWKAAERKTAMLAVVTEYPDAHGRLEYRLSFTETAKHLLITEERIDKTAQNSSADDLIYSYQKGSAKLLVRYGHSRSTTSPRNIDSSQSIFAQRKDPEQYPELTYLGALFGSFRLYRDWSFRRGTPPRAPQPADLENDYLAEDASNLGLILNRLRKNYRTKRRMQELLRKFYDRAEDVDVLIEGGTVQVFVQEKDYSIAAPRISDGTLRWICLLAVLLHPSPPSLLCFEEPEIGLHPDMISTLAELLQEASGKTQVVVTTHSDVLVDALSGEPENIIVCEKEEGSTSLRRLERKQLGEWLQTYSLGHLWRRGDLGGNRW